MEPPEWALRARSVWRYRGQARPPFAITPGPGQESVWDYPRPPRIQLDHREVIVRVGSHEIARSRRSIRMMETASPPTFYLPPDDVRMEFLERDPGTSRCEWKGEAHYWSITSIAVPGRRMTAAAWSYPDPMPGAEHIRGYFSFYPSRVDCFVDSVRVAPQPGGFYGGWVTPELVGPFKGQPGSEHW